MIMRNSMKPVAALIAACVLITPAWAQSDWQFSGVDRIVAVADIHGAYGAFERILGRAGVIDTQGAWVGADTHLVIVGDVLDRGADSRRALDLIMRLESEAAAAGGRVHMLLGNHEVMNLTGDLRYVSVGEYAAFADDETAAMRETAFAAWSASLSDSDDPDTAAPSFGERFPPGYFAHRQAFASDGVYGNWLKDKPLLLVIDGIAFVHGGLGRGVIEYGEALNDRLRSDLGSYLSALETLTEAGVFLPTDDIGSQGGRITGSRESGQAAAWSPAVRDAADRFIELQSSDLFSPVGPVWYRGNVSCNRLTERDRLDEALAGIGAEHLVVGHTPTGDASILSRMDETLFRIDTGMLNEYYGGRASALVIEGAEIHALYENEAGLARPLAQPRRVGIRPADLDMRALEAFLSSAAVEEVERYDASAQLMRLTSGGVELMATFTVSPNADFRPAIAAYRLDTLLSLDMVPVTVIREIDGVAGELTYMPMQSFTERERVEQNRGGTGWCPLGDQLNDMYLFDMLIFNRARTPDRVLYSADNLQVMLIGNDQAFATDRGRPAYLASISPSLTPAWREALAALDEDSLTAVLGDVLDRRRIRALLARRDSLLESGP